LTPKLTHRTPTSLAPAWVGRLPQPELLGGPARRTALRSSSPSGRPHRPQAPDVDLFQPLQGPSPVRLDRDGRVSGDRVDKLVVGEHGARRGPVHQAARRVFDKHGLARYFRVSTDTIDRLVKAGHLRAVRIGNQVRFTLEDVEGFIERQKIRGEAA
jgi:excisionase family DNA binding protein